MFSSKTCMFAVSLALLVTMTSCWASDEAPKVKSIGPKSGVDLGEPNIIVKRASSRSVRSTDPAWDAAWNAAWAKYWKGDYDGCIADCGAMIAKDPNDGSAYGLRAFSKMAKTDNYGAMADSFHAAVIYPDWGFAPMVKARAEYNLGDFKSAVIHCTRAIQLGGLLDTFLTDAYYFRGLANESLEDYGNALLDYGTASERNQTWSNPLFYRCRLNNKLGANRDALVDAEALIKAFPNDGDSFRMHGRALEAVGRKTDAIAACQKAKELYEQNNNQAMVKFMEDEIQRLQTSA